MNKPNKITLLFLLIFLLGVIGFMAYINQSLDQRSEIDPFQKNYPTQNSSVTFEE